MISRKRFRTPSTKEDIVQLYKALLSAAWISREIAIRPWYSPDEDIILHCKAMPDIMPPGFARVGPERYQFSFTIDGTRVRPVAYRVAFLDSPVFADQSLTVSHLCHNNWCMNWEHHVLESLEVNKARNGCPGGPHCHHRVKCLRPGPFSEA